MSLLELFCDVDDFWLDFEPQWKAGRLAAGKQRERAVSQIPTISLVLQPFVRTVGILS